MIGHRNEFGHIVHGLDIHEEIRKTKRGEHKSLYLIIFDNILYTLNFLGLGTANSNVKTFSQDVKIGHVDSKLDANRSNPTSSSIPVDNQIDEAQSYFSKVRQSLKKYFRGANSKARIYSSGNDN